jgi:hypothetical protein
MSGGMLGNKMGSTGEMFGADNTAKYFGDGRARLPAEELRRQQE